MKRVVFVLALLALVLAGCGGSSADTTVADPPNSSVYERSGNATLDKIVDEWQAQVPAQLTQYSVQTETIEQKVYQSSASLDEVAKFYADLTTKGWIETPRMPGVQDGFYAKGYDLGTTHLVIGAVDATKFGGNGVVIYTAKGNT